MAKKPPSRSVARAGSDILELDDNRLAAALYGEHSRNLALMENRLDVSLQGRGNRLLIEGAPQAVTAARRVLTGLYARLKSGDHLETADIEAAIRLSDSADANGPGDHEVSIQTRKRVITPRSATQRKYMKALQDDDMVFALGPAGTGKTFLAVAAAVARLADGSVDRLILSRPAVEAGERLGFLPGDLREKVDPYLRPLYDALYDTMPAQEIAKRFERGEIEVAPLAYMRGRTLSHCFVILDEAQNTTPQQMKMFLTRFGENCHMVVCGDPSQTDLPAGQQSGLHHAEKILADVPGISFVRFTHRDVVRHALVGAIVAAYERSENDGSRPKTRT
jgi:phosphate starvation-inducible PhoH-like protein